MDGFITRNLLIKYVQVLNRTIFDTGSTTRAFAFIDIPGFFSQSYLKVTRFTFYVIDFGVTKNLNVRMPSNLDELWGQDSY